MGEHDVCLGHAVSPRTTDAGDSPHPSPLCIFQAPLTLTLCFPGPDLEHLLQRALPDPAHGHLLHLHRLDLQ